MGPNFRRLVTMKMSRDAVPDGGDMGDALKFLTDKDRLSASAREAELWVRTAIDAVKAAPNNPHGDDDEAIAGRVLADVAKREGRSEQIRGLLAEARKCPACNGTMVHTRLHGLVCQRCR